MTDRINAVGLNIETSTYVDILLKQSDSWYGEMDGAPSIEQALWDEFQEQFAFFHEIVLAHRYLPANAQRAAIVERHFPTLEFAVRDTMPAPEISYEKIRWHKWPTPLKFSNIEELKWVEQRFVDNLVLKVKQPVSGKKKLKISCKLVFEKESFQDAIERYFSRYLETKDYQLAKSPRETTVVLQ